MKNGLAVVSKILLGFFVIFDLPWCSFWLKMNVDIFFIFKI